MEIYISSYSAYNNGTLAGGWFALSDYDNCSDLFIAANDLLTQQAPLLDHEELMLQDWEDIPNGLISESGADWEALFELAQMSEDDRQITIDYMDGFGTFDPAAARDAYIGEAPFFSDYRQLLIDQWYEITEVPEHLVSYIDDDAVFRCMDMDHTLSGTSIFINH